MRTNVCGSRVRVARAMQKPPMTQKELASKLQLEGIDIPKNSISLIEVGDRAVTDLELIALAKILGVTTAWLLEETSDPYQK